MLDSMARLKFGGTHANFYLVKQLLIFHSSGGAEIEAPTSAISASSYWSRKASCELRPQDIRFSPGTGGDAVRGGRGHADRGVLDDDGWDCGSHKIGLSILGWILVSVCSRRRRTGTEQRRLDLSVGAVKPGKPSAAMVAVYGWGTADSWGPPSPIYHSTGLGCLGYNGGCAHRADTLYRVMTGIPVAYLI